ncbi:hypothetical protein B0H11DRAFT_2041012 [Mycena galericulata]|nr:hypothetical protein B0H11DRAFT_2041012 [Mycena galericulata]
MERVCSIVCEPPLYWLSPSPHSPSLRHRQGRSSLAGPGVTAATLGAQGSYTGNRWFPPSHVVSMGGVNHRRVGASTAEDTSSINLYFLYWLDAHVLQFLLRFPPPHRRISSKISPSIHCSRRLTRPAVDWARVRRQSAGVGLQRRRTCADTARHFAAL